MGKFDEKITGMIMSAVKGGDKDKTNAYKNLKAKFTEFKTARNAKPLDDTAEISIMKKMVKELTEDAKLFVANNRLDLANDATKEASCIQVFLPTEATREDVENALRKVTNGTMHITKPELGITIQAIKAKFDSVDGKMVAEIVKEAIIN